MLGYRSGDWTPTVADYEAYLIRRHAVLAKKGGIAITMGGIIWRMAYEFMELDYDYYDAEPTESQRGLELKCEFGVYSGVTLTEEELDILCGTYKVYTETGESSTLRLSIFANSKRKVT
jgi:hypothetical protein